MSHKLFRLLAISKPKTIEEAFEIINNSDAHPVVKAEAANVMERWFNPAPKSKQKPLTNFFIRGADEEHLHLFTHPQPLGYEATRHPTRGWRVRRLYPGDFDYLVRRNPTIPVLTMEEAARVLS